MSLLADPNNPDDWYVKVEPYGSRRYVVYLACGSLRYGPDKYGWIRRTLPRAFAKGDRELERYRRKIRRLNEFEEAIRQEVEKRGRT